MITDLTIQESNLSYAWARAFLQTFEPGGDTKHPSVVTINNLDNQQPLEDFKIRNRLDTELRKYKLNLCGTVSNTIFPLSMWNQDAAADQEDIFDRYTKAWAGIKKCPANRNGVYFRRLTSFGPKGFSGIAVNQLQAVIKTYHSGNHRKSALQAAIFDPTRDHSNQRQKGFPCMQQVAFTPLPKNKLSIAGIYATQLQFEKAYGNYLGLYWLGRYMARQLNLELSQVVCMSAVVQRSDQKRSKGDLTKFANDIRAMLAPAAE